MGRKRGVTGLFDLILCASHIYAMFLCLFIVSMSSEEDIVQLTRGGKRKHVLALLDEGADPNERDPMGTSLVSWASLKGYMQLVQLLIERGANPYLKTDSVRLSFFLTFHSLFLSSAIEQCASPRSRFRSVRGCRVYDQIQDQPFRACLG